MKQHLRVVPESKRAHPRRFSVAGSTLFIMGATLASTSLGFMREVVSAKYYGTRWEMDTFLAAATIPTILFGVFNGALLSALVPTFSEYLAHREEAEAWRLANTVLNLLAVVLTACAVVGFFTARWYVPLIAHGFPAPQMGVAIRMTRWLMPTIVAVSLSGVLAAMLNAYHRFRATALVGVAVNIITIACVLTFNHRLGIYALVIGTTLGLSAQMLVQLPSFLSIGKYRFTIDLHHPGLKKIWTLLGPIVVGSAAGQIALFFDRFFASTLSPGYIAGMNYAVKLVNFPQQIFGAAIATVIFPLLAAQFARDNRRGVARSLVTGLRLVNFITIPAVCALIVLARPMVQTLFERGTFQAGATDLTAGLLPYAAVGLVALAANVVLTRCCFACKETAWPVTISVGAVIVNVLLSLVWLPTLGARGLLLANSLSQTMQAILLLMVVSRLVSGIGWGSLLGSTAKIVVSSLAMVAALHWIDTLGVTPEASLASRAWFLFGQIAIGGTVFVAVARMLNVEELELARRTIVAKFERNLVSPPDNREAPIA
ncbi:MAG TPA: murein biosynthesis integral membrane protein MurJ [Candidatus Baltobacteraceae bacterium]|nr:murein biosynthesis integral membrane protein MurJ [Candidatus Baltobacteraceae bacterium]